MSAKSAASGGDAPGPEAPVPEIDRCSSARKYALKALEASAAARSPKELAQAYGCESGHMGNVLSELRKDGEIERVERGLYTSKDGDSAGDDLAGSEQSERGATEESEEEVGEESESSTTDWPVIDDDERADLGPVEDVEADDSAGVDDGDEDGISAGTALVGATLALGLVVVVSGRSSSASTAPEEADETGGTDETDGIGDAEVWGE